MNFAQVHLALNHVPLILVLVGVSLLALALLRNSLELRAVAAALLVFATITTVPVFLSGEPTEEIVEHRPGVFKSLIHEHEEAGELSLIFISILGTAVVAVSLIERKKKARPIVWWALVAFGFFSFGAFVRTAHLGGLIRHDELRVGSAAASEEAGIEIPH